MKNGSTEKINRHFGAEGNHAEKQSKLIEEITDMLCRLGLNAQEIRSFVHSLQENNLDKIVKAIEKLLNSNEKTSDSLKKLLAFLSSIYNTDFASHPDLTKFINNNKLLQGNDSNSAANPNEEKTCTTTAA